MWRRQATRAALLATARRRPPTPHTTTACTHVAVFGYVEEDVGVDLGRLRGPLALSRQAQQLILCSVCAGKASLWGEQRPALCDTHAEGLETHAHLQVPKVRAHKVGVRAKLQGEDLAGRHRHYFFGACALLGHPCERLGSAATSVWSRSSECEVVHWSVDARVRALKEGGLQPLCNFHRFFWLG